MAQRRISFSTDEHLARRLAARAADLGKSLEEVIQQDLAGWLGDWGLSYTTHVVQPGETLRSIATRYYHDPAKSDVVAAFNDIADPNRLRVARVMRIPEAGSREPLPKGESPYIFGLHDRGGEHCMAWAGRRGWVLCSEALGCNPNDWRSKSYADLVDSGYGVIVRLNHGYGVEGTLPRSDRYKDFAARCGNYVESSRGCHIWIIANEMNVALKRPGGPANGEPITPDRYVAAFQACRGQIRRRSGHERDQVVVGAVGPWNAQTSYEGNPTGDWVTYFEHVLTLLQGELDGIAIHTQGRDPDPGNIANEQRMASPFEHRHRMFRAYVDFMEAVPHSLRHLPVYLTETDQNLVWANVNNGWIQEAYAEINRWNSDPTHQKIRCMLLYRWERHDMWHIRGKREVVNDFRAALQHEYRWYG